MQGDRSSYVGGRNAQGQRSRYQRADRGARDNVEDVAQRPSGTPLKLFEYMRCVEPSEAAAAQAQKLALIGRNLMVGGIEFDPGISAHG